MGRFLLTVVFAAMLATGGCSGIVSEAQMEAFFDDLGDTSITVYPTYIKRMAKDGSGKPLGHDAWNSGYEHNETERNSGDSLLIYSMMKTRD